MELEMENYQPKDSIITQENKPSNLSSTSNEIQNIFDKIRKKNKETEIKKNNSFENRTFNDISNLSLINNGKNKESPKDTIDCKAYLTLLLTIISFICFYLSFRPMTDFFFPISFYIFPMDLLSFILCAISSMITGVIISLIIIKKVNGFYILFMSFFYIVVFFLHHYKYIGVSHFDQSLSVYYVFLFLLIHSICIFFIFYFILKYYYYKGYLSKNNIFIKNLVSRWHSSEKIRRTENESMLLNDKSNIYIFSDKKRKNFKLYLIVFSLIGIQVIFLFLLQLKKAKILSCENWDKGINGTLINNNDKNTCKFQKPTGYCYMDFLKGYFDLTPNDNRNCSLRDSVKEKKYFLKNLENNNQKINLFSTKIFAFPHTNLDAKYFLKNQKSIRNFGLLVNDDIYDFEDSSYKNKQPKPEAILDFSENNIYGGKYGELKINVNFNKTLSEERKKLENNNSIFNNIFMLYVDATSRAHFQRTFPKLSKFIQNFMAYEPEKKINAYQVMKYHNFAPQTHFNTLPMFYGNSFYSNKGTHNVKYLKQNGFITGHEVDMCNKEQYDIFHGDSNNNDKIEYEDWDHENIAYLCDGNYYEIEDPYPGDRGAFSEKERCLYGHTVNYYMINYAKQFWEKYSNNKKYFRMAFNYGHEKTGAVNSYLDEPLYDFFFELYDKGYFDNTALFIGSDQGNQNNGIFDIINYSEFELEKKMGTFFLILSKNIKKYEENLFKNQQIMVTPYDIYNTMIHIVYGDDNNDIKNKFSADNKGKSVLFEINGNERNCQKYDDWSNNNFCCCIDN